MNIKEIAVGIGILLTIVNCKKEDKAKIHADTTPCTSPLIESGKVYENNERTYLWAGQDSSWHFDITGWSLKACQLNDYGLERESFAALVDAVYQPISEFDQEFEDNDKVIWVKTEKGVRIYPYTSLSYHEVVNESFDGIPIMIAYCHLADLAAVYTRVYCDREFTFGVSGYTYSDEYIWDGLPGFVLWDRETESLWWPLIDEAVSGIMKGNFLRKHSSSDWGYSTWESVKATYPDSQVLKIGQGWNAPETWPGYTCQELNCCL